MENYQQPNVPVYNYDPGNSWTSCPYCASFARVIGSNGFFFRCVQSGHQFEFGLNGYPIGIGAYAYVGGPLIIGQGMTGPSAFGR